MRSDRLKLIAKAAVVSERDTGCPAELTAAQCILESGWLSRAPGNNCFGIKRAKRHAKWQTLDTWEVENGVSVYKPQVFAAYDSLDECFTDHAHLITTGKPYADAWSTYLEDHDLYGFMERVARIYATDPNYYKKLTSIAGRIDVTSEIKLARSR